MTTLGRIESGESSTQTQSARNEPHVNVGMRERYITGAAGAVLSLFGLRRLGVFGLVGLGAGAMLLRRAVTGHCAGYQAMGISTAEEAAPEEYFDHGIHVEECYTINRPASELYQFWRKVENLPRFMEHLESVRDIDGHRSHWVAKGPAGMSVEWDAEIINDEPDSLISWKSLAEAQVHNAGTVRFEPDPSGPGTQVRVIVDYIPPGGRVASWFAKLFGRDANQMIRQDLRRFKDIMETADMAAAQRGV